MAADDQPSTGGPEALREGRAAQLCPVLIGRDDLLALADRRLAATATGAGELLLLSGEAGIGKTGC